MPLAIPLTYFLLLPDSSTLLYSLPSAVDEETSPIAPLSALPYTPLDAGLDEDGTEWEEEGSLRNAPKRGVALTGSDKLRLVRPLLLKYMLPLCEFSSYYLNPS
jgi:battenin